MTYPEKAGLFVLSNVILLPGNILPLQVFEDRYLNLIDDALGKGRYLAIVQPKNDNQKSCVDYYNVATLGQIVRFEEVTNNRYLVMIRGICRFDITDSILSDRGYQLAACDYTVFDDENTQEEFAIGDDDLQFLMNKVNIYFHHQEQLYDHQFLSSLSHEGLVNLVSMLCVQGSAEKQALLEAKAITQRFQILQMLLQMAQDDIIGHA